MKRVIFGIIAVIFFTTSAIAFTPIKSGDGLGQGHKLEIQERYIPPKQVIKKRKKRKIPAYYNYVKAPLIGKYLRKLKLSTKQKKEIYKTVVKPYWKELKKVKKDNKKIKPLIEAFVDSQKGFDGQNYLKFVQLKQKNIILIKIDGANKTLSILNEKQKEKLNKLVIKKKAKKIKAKDDNSTKTIDSNQTKKDKTK